VWLLFLGECGPIVVCAGVNRIVKRLGGSWVERLVSWDYL